MILGPFDPTDDVDTRIELRLTRLIKSLDAAEDAREDAELEASVGRVVGYLLYAFSLIIALLARLYGGRTEDANLGFGMPLEKLLPIHSSFWRILKRIWHLDAWPSRCALALSRAAILDEPELPQLQHQSSDPIYRPFEVRGKLGVGCAGEERQRVQKFLFCFAPRFRVACLCAKSDVSCRMGTPPATRRQR